MSNRPALDRAALVPIICQRMALGEPLAVICRDIDVSRRTVNRWRAEDPEIGELIQEARDDGYDVIAADCIRIADDSAGDWRTVNKQRGPEVNTEAVGRSKLRVDTRLKLLAKWDPKRYGDKLVTENTNTNYNTEIVDTDEMDSRLDRAITAALAARGDAKPDA